MYSVVVVNSVARDEQNLVATLLPFNLESFLVVAVLFFHANEYSRVRAGSSTPPTVDF